MKKDTSWVMTREARIPWLDEDRGKVAQQNS